MKHIALLFAFALLSIAAGIIFVNLVSANPGTVDLQYLPELIIKSDGSVIGRQVYPPYEEFQLPGFINRTGSIYTLTADIEGYLVRIDCSNIVFDGAGHIIYASPAFINSGLMVLRVNNVTVRNLEVTGSNFSNIWLSSSYCSIENVKTQGTIVLSEGSNFTNLTKSVVGGLSLSGEGNFISKCNISKKIIAVSYPSSNLFVLNNFQISNITGQSLIWTAISWDNGSVGNYWSDYNVKYPNAIEVDNTGISNTPYVIDQNNIDRHPLMYPYAIEKDQIALPIREPLPEIEGLSTVLVAGISIIVAGAAVGLFYYRKRHIRSR